MHRDLRRSDLGMDAAALADMPYVRQQAITYVNTTADAGLDEP
jgi:hypothetical protein